MQAEKVTASTPVSVTAVLFLFNPSFSAVKIFPRNWELDIQVEEPGYGPAPLHSLQSCWMLALLRAKEQVMITDALGPTSE